MTTLTINVEPIDIDAVVLPRERYNELLAAEEKAKAAPKPNPFGLDTLLHGLPKPLNPNLPREVQFPNAVYYPTAGDTAFLRRRYDQLEGHARRLRVENEMLEAQVMNARRDLDEARKEADTSKAKHRKATEHIAEYKRRVGEYERQTLAHRDGMVDARRQVADARRAATAAEQKVANTANIEITLRGNGQPAVALRYDGELLTGVLNHGELHPESIQAGYMLAANGFPGRISAPVNLRIGNASNVTVKR